MGMALAVIGMIIYSWAVEIEKKKQCNSAAAKVDLAAKTSMTEEEVRLLIKSGEIPTPFKDVEFGQVKNLT